MSGLFDLLQLLFVLAVFIAIGGIASAPYLFAGFIQGKNEEHQRRLLQEAELDRKVAIAEAAIAARARGETFVPPRDYDRSL
ncbi:MAG: hypothetical protein QOC65_646 [Sphingomonadales bacterium]|nr:hypothetical protein [Sphingomonadales bacterium]